MFSGAFGVLFCPIFGSIFEAFGYLTHFLKIVVQCERQHDFRGFANTKMLKNRTRKVINFQTEFGKLFCSKNCTIVGKTVSKRSLKWLRSRNVEREDLLILTLGPTRLAKESTEVPQPAQGCQNGAKRLPK